QSAPLLTKVNASTMNGTHLGNGVYGGKNGTLLPELRKIAEEELGETDSRRQEALAELVQLLEEEPELAARKDPDFLLRFIRVRKYDVEGALKTLRNYYKNRAACPSIYKEFLPSSVKDSARSLFIVLPERDVHGRLVLLITMGVWMPATLPYHELQQASMMCFEHMAADPSSQTAGISIIVDYHEFTPDKVFSCRIGLMRRAVEYMQGCLPVRMKAIHVVRQSYAFDLLFGLIRPFMKKKLVDRFHFHGMEFEALHEEIPASILPEEYGGHGPPLDFDGFWKRLEKEEPSYVENNRYGYHGKTQLAMMEDNEEVEITAL
ncbi:unnamed protein product, partial [Ixodes hexagonus]